MSEETHITNLVRCTESIVDLIDSYEKFSYFEVVGMLEAVKAYYINESQEPENNNGKQ